MDKKLFFHYKWSHEDSSQSMAITSTASWNDYEANRIRLADRQMDGQDQVLSHADALTKKISYSLTKKL